MREVGLLLGSVAVYAVIPLIIVFTRLTTRFILLYAYIAAVLVLGGLLGSVYGFPITDDVTLLAGQVSYGALMFATLVTVVESRDLQAVRNIVTLVVTVNVVVFALFRISQYALTHGEVINPLQIDPALFSSSIRILLSGGALIVGELMLLLGILEKAKRSIGPRGMFGVYPLAFVGILVVDGVLFPVLAFFPFEGLGSVIASGVEAKLILAGVYALPLILFLVLRRSALSEYHATPIYLRHLLSGDTNSALAQIERQEQQIVEQRQRLRATTARPASATVAEILDAATNTVAIALDLEFRITHFNVGAERVLGWSSAEVIGRTSEFLHDPDYWIRRGRELTVHPDPANVINAHATLATPRALLFRTRSGETVHLSFSTTKVFDAEGRLLGYVGMGEDITERQHAHEATVQALRREQNALIRLQEVDRLKADLISTVSHELRTPLASIIGYVELLEWGDFEPLTPDQASAMGTVRRNAHRLEKMVESLLTLSRIEGTQDLDSHRLLDLREVVDSVRDLFEDPTSDEHKTSKLELHFDVSEGQALVQGDWDALQRLVTNLVDNAIKFTERGSVNVTVHADAEAISLTVADTGIGIASDDQPHLFTSFFRSKNAVQRAIPGSGLGLSIVFSIAQHHGADIDVRSDLGSGTAFTVRFPVPVAKSVMP